MSKISNELVFIKGIVNECLYKLTNIVIEDTNITYDTYVQKYKPLINKIMDAVEKL